MNEITIPVTPIKIKVILSGKNDNILSVIFTINVPKPKSTGQNKMNKPKIIPAIDKAIPVPSYFSFSQSHAGNNAKQLNIIPEPGLNMLYKKIFIANFLFGESFLASNKLIKTVNKELP